MGKWQLHHVISFQLLMLGWVAHPAAEMPRQNRITVAVNLFLSKYGKKVCIFPCQ